MKLQHLTETEVYKPGFRKRQLRDKYWCVLIMRY